MVVDEHTKFSDVAWNYAQLTRVEWPSRLGDEHNLGKGKRQQRIHALRDASRAYRGLSLTLRQQGGL